ncbi:MAG: hypothetical protein HYY04_17400 [Chloroflexi bacterium]|nr:hypothetical protein [Chloroflexota bacterium]
MIVRQRPTIADDFLLQVLLPYLDPHLESRATRHLLKLTRYWNPEIRPTNGPARIPVPSSPASRLRERWRRLLHVVSEASASVGLG